MAGRGDGVYDGMVAYRDFLIAADQKASEAYDKTIMTLSGGALGLSVTFLKDIVGDSKRVSVCWLEASWMCLTVSLLLILASMLFSQWALRKAINQVDTRTLDHEQAGGLLSFCTASLNVFAGLLCVAGIMLLAWFSLANIK